jgi:hypothetical protein
MPLSLADPALYVDQMRALADRDTRSSRSPNFTLTAPLVAAHAEKLAPRLAREVSRGTYQFSPLVPRQVLMQGKQRTLFASDALDAVVWSALAQVLREAAEPHWGSHLFSYRPGHSQWTACRAFSRYAREHVRARPDPRQRGLFVLRRDVRGYGESIAVHDRSSLWPTLQGLLAGASVAPEPALAGFLRSSFCPKIQQDTGAHPLEVGVPTGLPLQTIACNAYLLPLDRELCGIPGGFYARFGDDLLFAHPEQAAVEGASAVLDRGVSALELTFNPRKSQDLWLTVPGRPHPDAQRFTPCARFAYLGFDVGFHGAQLRADKRRALWLSLRARLRQTERLLGSVSDEERASVLCSVVATAFDLRSPLSERYAPWLRLDVMAREDLLQLDHLIALHIAERVSCVRGVRAFRRLSKRRLYGEFGLPSLVQRWDEARRARQP